MRTRTRERTRTRTRMSTRIRTRMRTRTRIKTRMNGRRRRSRGRGWRRGGGRGGRGGGIGGGCFVCTSDLAFNLAFSKFLDFGYSFIGAFFIGIEKKGKKDSTDYSFFFPFWNRMSESYYFLVQQIRTTTDTRIFCTFSAYKCILSCKIIRHTDRWMDRRIDRPTDRQIDRPMKQFFFQKLAGPSVRDRFFSPEINVVRSLIRPCLLFSLVRILLSLLSSWLALFSSDPSYTYKL